MLRVRASVRRAGRRCPPRVRLCNRERSGDGQKATRGVRHRSALRARGLMCLESGRMCLESVWGVQAPPAMCFESADMCLESALVVLESAQPPGNPVTTRVCGCPSTYYPSCANPGGCPWMSRVPLPCRLAEGFQGRTPCRLRRGRGNRVWKGRAHVLQGPLRAWASAGRSALSVERTVGARDRTGSALPRAYASTCQICRFLHTRWRPAVAARAVESSGSPCRLGFPALPPQGPDVVTTARSAACQGKGGASHWQGGGRLNLAASPRVSSTAAHLLLAFPQRHFDDPD